MTNIDPLTGTVIREVEGLREPVDPETGRDYAEEAAQRRQADEEAEQERRDALVEEAARVYGEAVDVATAVLRRIDAELGLHLSDRRFDIADGALACWLAQQL